MLPGAIRNTRGLPLSSVNAWCALAWELSMLAITNKLVLPVSALNMSNQMPWRLQRLKRL
jgi:hypothetical protein